MLGWVIWDRWYAHAATLFVWALYLLPIAVAAQFGTAAIHYPRIWVPILIGFPLSLLLVEVGLHGRDRYQRLVRRG